MPEREPGRNKKKMYIIVINLLMDKVAASIVVTAACAIGCFGQIVRYSCVEQFYIAFCY